MLILIIMAVLGVFGVTLVAGSVVAYRGSARVWVRAFAAGAITAGIVILVLVLFVTSVSVLLVR